GRPPRRPEAPPRAGTGRRPARRGGRSSPAGSAWAAGGGGWRGCPRPAIIPRPGDNALPMAATRELSHVYPLGSRVNEAGRLEVGGCDALELAREHGTPAYVVAEDDLRARARAFQQALAARHDDFEVLFASKAFPCTAAYRLFAAEGAPCDVAPGGGRHVAV